MSSALRRSTRARTGAQRAAAAAEEANDEDCPLYDLMAVPDYCEVLCEQLDYALLAWFRVSRALRRWIDPLLAGRSVEDVDVRAGRQVQLLRHLCAMENRVVRLARGEYEIEGDVRNAMHSSNSMEWDSYSDDPVQWREGYGPLRFAAGITLVGQDGAVLIGQEPLYDMLELHTGGVRFDSINLPQGVKISKGGSLTMTKCTSTGEQVTVEAGGRLVMEDSRIFGVSGSYGVRCEGSVKATRCIVENNQSSGVVIWRERASAELVECVIRKNGQRGLFVFGENENGSVVLRGGTVSENADRGVYAFGGAKITVAPAKEDVPQTVCKANGRRGDWATMGSSEIIGIPQEKINASAFY